MTTELVKILEVAKAHYDCSMRYFDYFSDENDQELKEIYWSRCQEESGKADGLLKAYEIITGKKLYQHQIQDNLLVLA